MRTARLVAAVFALCAAVQGQTLIVTRSAPNPIANFDVGFIDVGARSFGPPLFQLQILPPVPQTADRYHIVFTVSCSTSVVSGTLLQAQTGDFLMKPGGYLLTNNEFFADGGPDQPSIHTTISAIDRGARARLLGAGTLPSGRVTLDFTLVRQRDGQVAPGGSARIWYDIVAIRYVKLVTPGASVSASGGQAPQTFSSYPQFVWSSDLMPIAYPPGSVKFAVAVYENADDAHGGAGITSTKPFWVDTISGGSSVNYAQYPVSGVRALVPGVVYYWQVRAVLQGPTTRAIESELFAFSVADLAIAGTLSPTQSDILKYLAIILGSNYAFVLPSVRGMKPDERVVLDGGTLTLESLRSLAEEFALGQRTVTHVQVK